MRAKFPYKKRKKRLGCGIGSGHGKTATKGHKGQRARAGYAYRPGFEGGQTPLYRRLPKRGFSRVLFHETYKVFNLDLLAALGEKDITPELLKAKGYIKNLKHKIKILGNGVISAPLTVKAHAFSGSAKEKITKAGGQAVLITKE